MVDIARSMMLPKSRERIKQKCRSMGISNYFQGHASQG